MFTKELLTLVINYKTIPAQPRADPTCGSTTLPTGPE